MIKATKYLSTSFTVVFTLLAIMLLGAQAYSIGSANISLNFDKATYALNDRVELNVIIGSGTQSVIAGTVDLRYDQTKLQLVSIENSSEVFKGEVSASGGNGTLNITKYAVPIGEGATGNNLYSTVVFKAVSSGIASVSVADSTVLFGGSGNDSIWNGDTNQKSITVLVSEASNIITLTANNNQSLFDTVSKFAVDASRPTDDVQVEFPDRPIPIDTSETIISDRFVSIKVVNSAMEPVEQARVALDGILLETDSTGIASFESVSPGIYEISLSEPDGEVVRTTIDVRDDSEPLEVQEFEFVVGETEDDSSSPVAIFIVSVVVVVLATVGLVVYQKRKNTNNPL